MTNQYLEHSIFPKNSMMITSKTEKWNSSKQKKSSRCFVVLHEKVGMTALPTCSGRYGAHTQRKCNVYLSLILVFE
jgi:hypothetical protein